MRDRETTRGKNARAKSATERSRAQSGEWVEWRYGYTQERGASRGLGRWRLALESGRVGGVALFACFIVQQAGHKGPAIIEPCSGWPNRLKELLGMARALCRAGPGPVVVRVRLVSGKKT